MDRASHRANLVFALDAARLFHQRLAVLNADALPLKRLNTLRIAVIESESSVAANMLPHERADFSGPSRNVFGAAVARSEVKPWHAWPHFVDRIRTIAQEFAIRIPRE
ncbi:hypothetical protein [Caballeronia sp. BCC1704]|uniref:hypothetical protein n=1 Tax=Caballeronia sp. BCC1704 TaxID=2676300 RepID=UPI001ABBDFC3|nr:hypothetical protein [Caballeronia sp. BCC1704]